jgi:putative oxidoreductase
MISSSKAFRIGSATLRIALGVIFLYAAWTKMYQMGDGYGVRSIPWQLFAASIDDYKVAPDWALEPLARTLPWFEALLGVILIVGRWFVRTASAIIAAMLVVFLTLMTHAYAAGLKISCGCFGPGEQISWLTFLRDGSLLALSLAVLWLSFMKKRKKTRLGPVEVPASAPPQP